jgi:acyl-CoA dehydrogenase
VWSAPGDLAVGHPASPRLARATSIADGVAAAAAADVDRAARFPREAMDALRAERLLSALAPAGLGGEGGSFSEAGLIAEVLARRCASTAMIYAMHQIQLACLMRHGRNPALRDFIGEVTSGQLLLASATTEVGTGGDIRSSRCAVDQDDKRFTVEKMSTVISYALQADAILATARRSRRSPPSDQVLVVCRSPDLELSSVSEWNTIGMRGTCSPGYLLRARGSADLILDDPFSEILTQTMLPVAHAFWASVWLGIGTEAITRARGFVQTAARKAPGHLPLGAFRLAQLEAKHDQFKAIVRCATARLDHTPPAELATVEAAIFFNSLKVSAATLVVDMVGQALVIIGIPGYQEESEYGLGRLLRDAYSAPIMVNDDRITENNAQLALVHKEAAR